MRAAGDEHQEHAPFGNKVFWVNSGSNSVSILFRAWKKQGGLHSPHIQISSLLLSSAEFTEQTTEDSL